jgi:FtsP/CotA-like multicopper oxidase with cupredoxin domain
VSNAQRLVVLVVAVVVLGGGFVLLSRGGGDDDETAGTTATAPVVTSDGATPASTTAAPEPAVTTIRVANGKPVGGVKAITVRKGDRVRIVVASADTTDEVHLHGYDIKRDLAAGGRVRFSFTADAEGIFEMELESSSTQIAKLEVRPR